MFCKSVAPTNQYWRGVENCKLGPPTQDPLVNKRDLSTGENGELDSETLASNADPVTCPRCLYQ